MRPTQTVYGLHAVRALLERHPERVVAVRLAVQRDDPRARHIEELAREQIRLIDADIEKSRRMVLNKWKHRKFGRRINERLALLLRSQL